MVLRPADVMRGGTVSAGAYRASAVRACSAANVEQPWACADLAFVVALLHDAYKIRDNDAISVRPRPPLQLPLL